jgi:hypothetical protein
MKFSEGTALLPAFDLIATRAERSSLVAGSRYRLLSVYLVGPWKTRGIWASMRRWATLAVRVSAVDAA